MSVSLGSTRGSTGPVRLDGSLRAMIVGPSRSSSATLARAGRQCGPFPEDEFLSDLNACGRLGAQVLGADQPVLVLSCTGTVALEAVAVSLIPRAARILVVVTGAWGQRWVQICRTAGLDVRELTATPGSAPSAQAVAERTRSLQPAAVLATHVDSSTGVRLDLAALCDAARAGRPGGGPLVLVDGVCAAGAEVVECAQWGVDGYVTSSAKALAAPGGVALIALSDRARDTLGSPRRRTASFALDLAPWVKSQAAAARGRFEYVQSPAGNLIAALAVALDEVTREGITARAARHRRLRDRLHRGLLDLGIPVLAADPDLRAHAVTVGLRPRADADRCTALVREHGVVLAPPTTPGLAERTIRIGHLGHVDDDDIDATLAALAGACHVLERGQQ